MVSRSDAELQGRPSARVRAAGRADLARESA